jgi:hypothetical protein
MKQLRALPWWALALIALAGLFLIGAVADGYVFRTAGAVIKTALGLALGYYAHRHLVMQGARIQQGDTSSAANAQRTSRAIVMGACALAVGLAV